jgi:hypothetical protein
MRKNHCLFFEGIVYPLFFQEFEKWRLNNGKSDIAALSSIRLFVAVALRLEKL